MRPLDAFGPRSWARPESVAFNRLPAAAPLRRETEVALDGDWAFVLRERPEAVTPGDLVDSTEGWATVEVPGCWTMQGFDRPQYTNVQMPFPGPPPSVPDDNPTGVYRRRVAAPGAWAGRRVVLHVGGAETVLYVYVDGRPVGMGKDSRLPQEYDLTDLLVPGESVDLALVVVRWSDATYLEDQDHWHHAGLHRSVRLAATPSVHLADVRPVADFDPGTGVGHLDVRAVVGAEGHGPADHSIRVDVAGTSVTAPVPVSAADASEFDALAFGGRIAHATVEVPGVEPWSAERPALHPLSVALLDPSGVEIDAVALDIGFRRVEIVQGELRVNGRPILVKGVNRHDHDERRGKAVTAESIEADLVAMKRHNLNAVRTSHYPNDPHLYDRCDRLGLYVVDEANIETHAHLRSLTRDPRWGPALFERVTRMAVRDVAHPSIVLWSLGNESGSAPIHRAMAEWLRAFDPTRPIQYEGGLADDLFADLAAGIIPDMAELLSRPHPESDVVAPMYPEIGDIVGWAEAGAVGGPLIMCEYEHAMGNSCGGFDEYWAAIRSTPGLQGGFVWDWMDQALVQRRPDGTERLAYGGDFGDEPNDGAFCLNGLVASDRTPHPSLTEAAAVLSPVRITPLADRPAFSVRNEHSFVDLSWLEARWVVAVDGVESERGDLGVVRADPGETVEVEVPVTAPAVGAGERATLELSFVTGEVLPWAPAGHVVARGQAELAVGPGPAAAPREGPDPTPPSDPEAAVRRFEPVLALWRAPIDNETFGPIVGQRHADRWAEMGLRDAAASVALDTRVAGDGSGLTVEHEVTVPEGWDDIPRVGVRLRLGRGIDRVEWLGDGPHECYADRRSSARFARWSCPVDDWTVPYVHPQASGNRTGVRWIRFLGEDDAPVLTIDHLDGLDVSVSRWTDEEVADAAHLEDLPARDECYVWIDAAHRGVGSAAVGPDVAPEHRVGPGRHRWSYRLRPSR